jgi:hypothetical protein
MQTAQFALLNVCCYSSLVTAAQKSPNFIERRLRASGNDQWQMPKTISRPQSYRAEKLPKKRKGAEHAGKYRQILWGVLRVPSFSTCSAFSAEQLQPD